MIKFYNFENNKDNKILSIFKNFMIRVYFWMFLGLMITFFVSLYITKSYLLINLIYESKILLLITILQIFLVYLLSNVILFLDYKTAILLFIIYSILNGITMSSIFLIYTLESIFNIFLSTSFIFIFMTLYGLLTNRDLTDLGNLLLTLIFGILLSSIINIILNSTLFMYFISYISIFIFIGLISYDTQKLKYLSNKLYLLNNSEEITYKYSILGALILYLDFINIFLIPIKIFGKKNNENNYY